MKTLLPVILLLFIFSCNKGTVKCDIAIKNNKNEAVRVIVDGYKKYVMQPDGYSYDDYLFDVEYGEPVRTVEMYVMGTSGEYDELINSVDIKVENGALYYLNTEEPHAVDLATLSGEPVDSSDDSDDPVDIVGSWMKTTGCANLNGHRPIFRFDADGTGYFFTPDCDNACESYGFYVYFNYAVHDEFIDVVHTGASEYCGIVPPVSGDEIIDYSFSGTTLTLNEIAYEKM